MSDILPLLPKVLRVVAPTLSASEVDLWATVLTPSMRSSGIINPRRAAAFLGQVAHESQGFRVLEENLHYSAERLCKEWPMRFVIPTSAQARACAGNPEALANTVYGGRLGNCRQGDGWLFHGRGIIQLTGRDNYQAFANAIGADVSTIPALLLTPAGSAKAACWFWTRHGINPMADGWDIESITRTVNGGTNGLKERTALSERALAAFDETYQSAPAQSEADALMDKFNPSVPK